MLYYFHLPTTKMIIQFDWIIHISCVHVQSLYFLCCFAGELMLIHICVGKNFLFILKSRLNYTCVVHILQNHVRWIRYYCWPSIQTNSYRTKLILMYFLGWGYHFAPILVLSLALGRSVHLLFLPCLVLSPSRSFARTFTLHISLSHLPPQPYNWHFICEQFRIVRKPFGWFVDAICNLTKSILHSFAKCFPHWLFPFCIWFIHYTHIEREDRVLGAGTRNEERWCLTDDQQCTSGLIA